MRYEDPIPDLKRQLAAELVRVMDGWRMPDVAAMLRTDPPRVSDLRRARLDRFSLEAIVRFLTRMDHRVEFTVISERQARLKAISMRAK